MEISTYEEKPKMGIMEKVKKGLRKSRIATAAAFGAGVTAVMAIPGQASATGTTTSLQQIALDWGMSVPSIFIMAAFLICLVAVMVGWARTQYGYYVTVGLGAVWLIMQAFGL